MEVTPGDRAARLAEGMTMAQDFAHIESRDIAACWEDDLYGAALEALARIVDDFDPARGNKFATFARHRLRGAVIDERRRLVTGRYYKGRLRSGNERRNDWIGYERRDPRTGMVIDLTDQVSFRESIPIENAVDDRLEQAWIGRLSAELSDRDREILSWYYLEGRSQRDIAETLGVTESRVCQILGEIRRRLHLKAA